MFLIRELVSARTWLAYIHHLVGVAVGFAAAWIVLAGIAGSLAGLPFALIGLVVLGFTLRFVGVITRLERVRFAVLLEEPLPAWPSQARAGYRMAVVPRGKKLTERATWREVAYIVLRAPVSALFAFVSLGALVMGLAAFLLPLYNEFLPSGGAHVGAVVLHGFWDMLASASAGLALLLAAPWLAQGFAKMDAALARGLLCPPSDLAARVTELERSRERVVDAAESERRRIERDLHDGAQQRLVALAMELGRAQARFDDDLDTARRLVDHAHVEAKAVLTELRNLVRGVHPPVLSDRGLDAALSGLAALCPVPVDVEVDVPVRPKPVVEAAAYFVVAEALTNVAKHSRASRARVVVEGHGFPGTLSVVITDDGIGGADADGAGLRGLADRVEGVDGRLTVESPPGGPTIIAGELPCG
ncbi:MAG TPA: sensor domain-containing protein [Trebonia sp.]|jgi:signal transduction histidine kinase|nr:sensor domain-containing protein [Trebonia sp.]